MRKVIFYKICGKKTGVTPKSIKGNTNNKAISPNIERLLY